MEAALVNSPLYVWVIIPLLICVARIADVSIGTVRIIFVSKGNKTVAAFLGFFEVIIWLLAIAQVMKHLSNPLSYIGYGMGFALGNYVGISIEEKIAIGYQVVRFITRDTVDILAMALRDAGFGTTVIEAKGGKGIVNIVFTIIPRQSVRQILSIAAEIDPDVFVSVQDIRSVKSGYLPSRSSMLKWRKWNKNK